MVNGCRDNAVAILKESISLLKSFFQLEAQKRI